MKPVPLVTREYRTIEYVSGPLIFVSNVRDASFGENARITLRNGEERTGQVLDISEEHAETETAMRRLGSEIQKTRRRVNALEQILIPELKSEAKYIRNAIEEREREDMFRLKKVKSILERKKKVKEKKEAARNEPGSPVR